MPSSFYVMLWIFLIYAVIGWCIEVAFAAVNRGGFVNRGFLNGRTLDLRDLQKLFQISKRKKEKV